MLLGHTKAFESREEREFAAFCCFKRRRRPDPVRTGPDRSLALNYSAPTPCSRLRILTAPSIL